jgi:hypothetical protein
MSTHDAAYVRQRRRAQGIPARDPVFAPRFQQRATELQRLEQLPWPKNLFGEPASIAELMAESTQLSVSAGENADGACSCGCRKEHKQNVSQTLRNPYGRGFDVIYFVSAIFIAPDGECCRLGHNTGNRRARIVALEELLSGVSRYLAAKRVHRS